MKVQGKKGSLSNSLLVCGLRYDYHHGGLCVRVRLLEYGTRADVIPDKSLKIG